MNCKIIIQINTNRTQNWRLRNILDIVRIVSKTSMISQKKRSDSSATSTDLEEDDLGSRWGWFGFTPDCLQRFNTGYSWGVAIVLTNMATTFVITGLLGMYSNCHHCVGRIVKVL